MICHQNVDDIPLNIRILRIKDVLNKCLEMVIGWMKNNKVILNPSKAEIMLVDSSQILRYRLEVPSAMHRAFNQLWVVC